MKYYAAPQNERMSFRVFGPEIEFKIQTSQGIVLRKGVFENVYLRNIVYVHATDDVSLQPRFFFVKEGIDWDLYYRKISDYWNRKEQVSYPFRLLKRLPVEVAENFKILPLQERHQIIAALRQKGILPKIYELKKGNQPKNMEWFEVADLCVFGVQ